MLLKGTKKFDCDLLAQNLAFYGRLGRSMPPVWKRARISVPLFSGGGCIGRVLPGRGLYLDHDLKYFGIRRPVPNVFQRSVVQKLFDVLHSDRAAISAAAMLLAAATLPGAIPPFFQGTVTSFQGLVDAVRLSRTTRTVFIRKFLSYGNTDGAWSHIFRETGDPAAGSFTNIPGGSAFDKDSAGSFSKGLFNPTSPAKCYLLTFGVIPLTQSNPCLLIDLLVGAGNIATNIDTLQTVNSTALTRYTNGEGVMMMYQVVTTLGATSTTLTTTYTNQAGAGSRSAVDILNGSIGAGRIAISGAGSIGPLSVLQSGDFGVQSVQSCQLTAALTGTGTIALVIYFPLAFVGVVQTSDYIERDFYDHIDGVVEIVTTAGGVLGCLSIIINNTGVLNLTGSNYYVIRTVNG